MTDKRRELLRSNLYIIVGALVGFAIGLSVSTQLREFVIISGWPKESIGWFSMSLIFISIMLNAFLYQGWKMVESRELVKNPTLQPESK